MKCYVVADTNIIVSAFISVMRKNKVEDSVPLKVLSLLLDKKNKIIPVFNDDILDEYKEVMSRPEFRISKPIIGKFLNDIRSIGVSLEAAEIDDELPDSDDVVFYEEDGEVGAVRCEADVAVLPAAPHLVPVEREVARAGDAAKIDFVACEPHRPRKPREQCGCDCDEFSHGILLRECAGLRDGSIVAAAGSFIQC